jgi:endonuclease G
MFFGLFRRARYLGLFFLIASALYAKGCSSSIPSLRSFTSERKGSPSSSGSSNKNHFFGGARPQFTNKKLAAKTRFLSFDGFALMHSGVSRTPLWVAEHLTRSRILAARSLPRHNAFHAEESLPASERSELEDYRGSGFDRGHMSPSSDQETAEAQEESFSLANIVPQNSDNNQKLWEGIEYSVKGWTIRAGELYVITGPFFGSSIERINGRVFVPARIFKAVYDPNSGQGSAYLANNVPGMDYEVVSLAELERLIGIDLFPAVSDAAKQHKIDLPPPRTYSRGRGYSRY